MSQQQRCSYLRQEGESRDAYSDRFFQRGTVNHTRFMWVLADTQGQQRRSGQRMFLHILQTALDL
jgi:hypothetical protein